MLSKSTAASVSFTFTAGDVAPKPKQKKKEAPVLKIDYFVILALKIPSFFYLKKKS